jgi:hypothetical protein
VTVKVVIGEMRCLQYGFHLFFARFELFPTTYYTCMSKLDEMCAINTYLSPQNINMTGLYDTCSKLNQQSITIIFSNPLLWGPKTPGG